MGSFLFLCFTQLWNLGRLLLQWAKEPAEVVGAGAVRLPHVWSWCAPHWAFFPWRQVKQQCRSHSVAEG